MPSSEKRSLLLTLVGLAAAVVWLFQPLWDGNGDLLIVGDPQTDAIRGAWGFDHLHAAISRGELPWNTARLNFPVGVELMVLPLASGLALVPLGWLDPIVAWNLSLMLLMLGSAFATAWLARVMTDSWAAGLMCGLALLGQPMVHHALADGTAEHIALWALPMLIGAAHLALAEQSPKWGFATGLLAIAVALDSPYQALYALVLGCFVLPWAIRVVHGRQRDMIKSLGAMTLASAVGIAIVFYLYGRFRAGVSTDQDTAMLQQTNATDMRLWWRHLQIDSTLRDHTRPPTIIPSAMVAGGLTLGILGGKRALPWIAAAVVMLGLSFGLRTDTPDQLASWLGAPAGALGTAAMALNEVFYTLPIAEQLRFPRRWLVPSSMALSIAAAIGLASLFQRYMRPAWMQWGMAVLVGSAVLSIGVKTSKVHNAFPVHKLPSVDFADELQSQPDSGAVMLLPVIRELPPGATRANLPVFARLGSALASADDLYLQMLHGRAMVSFPSLQTLTAREQNVDVSRLMRDWSDLSDGGSTNRGIPPSAFDPGAAPERNRGLQQLRDAGLKWLVVDLGAYDDEGLGHLREQVGTALAREREYAVGDGVLVMELLPGIASN